MVLARIGEEGSLAPEPGKPAIELRFIATEVVRPHLVDDDQHLEPWSRCLGMERMGQGAEQYGEGRATAGA